MIYNMLINIIFIVLFRLVVINTIQIPFIKHVIFIPISNSTSTIITNRSCNECLCLSNSSYVALNCFPNATCQFFYTFPRAYELQSIVQGRFYFLQESVPNPSECCVANTSYLLTTLNETTPIIAKVFQPRCIVLDNNGYIVTVSQTNWTIVRLYSTNLTIVDQPIPPIFPISPETITYYNEAYYVGFAAYILVLDSGDFSVLHNITTSLLNGARGMMFLNNGETLIVASTMNRYILFFNRSSPASKDYTYIGEQLVNYSYPHGLWSINDSYFYVTSWGDITVHSYSATNIDTVWIENLFLDPTSVATTNSGNHLTIDECNRYWYSLGPNGIRIFDSQGLLLANFTQMTPFVFDTLITAEYVIYLSDSNSNQILRIDSKLQCTYFDY